MAKEKKIGVKFYANQRIKPKSILWNNAMVTAYPLYCAVSFNQDTGHFRVLVDQTPVLVTPDLAQLKGNSYLEKTLSDLEEQITRVIKVLSKYNPDFSARNINRKVRAFKESISTHALEAPMSLYMGRIVDESYSEYIINTIVYGIKVLLEDFSSMTVLDWLDGGNEKLRLKLEKYENIDSDFFIDILQEVLLMESTEYIDAVIYGGEDPTPF